METSGGTRRGTPKCPKCVQVSFLAFGKGGGPSGTEAFQFCQLKFVVKAWRTNQVFFLNVFLVLGGAWRGTPQIASYLRGSQRRHSTRNATDLALQPWKPEAGRASMLFSPPLFS